MNLVYIVICGVTLGPLPPVPPTLERLYQQQYGCAPQHTQHPTDHPIAKENAGALFPALDSAWPIFTKEQIGGAIYLETLERGIKPGILLPNDQWEILRPSLYYRYKTAIQDGAIPVLEFQSATPSAFSAKASYAAAIGLSPLAALVTDGWSENALFLRAGTYLMDHRPRVMPPLLAVARSGS
jgi:hypothetical protein